MEYFDKYGWPVEKTKTELLFVNLLDNSLSAAFREACAEIDRFKDENKQLKDLLDNLSFQSQCSWCEKNMNLVRQALKGE